MKVGESPRAHMQRRAKRRSLLVNKLQGTGRTCASSKMRRCVDRVAKCYNSGHDSGTYRPTIVESMSASTLTQGCVATVCK